MTIQEAVQILTTYKLPLTALQLLRYNEALQVVSGVHLAPQESITDE